MIKEKAKKKRFDDEKTIKQLIAEFSRTIFLSILAAVIFTTFLSFRAKNEMIQNLYANAAEKAKMEEVFAKKIVEQSDFTKDLENKKYSICMQVGNLYEAAQKYENAELAYRYAVKKGKSGVYIPYFKLAEMLITQEKYDEANDIINSISDIKDKNLIKLKTRAYITMGDKYYSKGKFLSAAKSYEKANFYYNRFEKKDRKISASIHKRCVNAYIQAADVMVKNGYNSDAVRFLNKAKKYSPDNNIIKYKLGIIYADLDPIKAVKYFEPLLEKIPQDIDYEVYTTALMKAANITDLENNPTQAKYYRYRIHSIDEFIKHHVIYRNDVEIITDSIKIKKFLFRYIISCEFKIKNNSNSNIRKLSADFVLRNGDKNIATISQDCIDKSKTLSSYGEMTKPIKIKFKENIFTRKELSKYYIDVYVYKDEKYKTLAATLTLNSVKD